MNTHFWPKDETGEDYRALVKTHANYWRKYQRIRPTDGKII